jgi:hypothetical protein
MKNFSRGKLLSIMISGILAIVFFYYAIDSFVEAKVNQNGGNVPIFAGHGDNREWVDDKWVSAQQYTYFLKREALEFAIYGIVCAGFLVYVCCSKEENEESEILKYP